MDRRGFIKKSTLIGAGAFVAANMVPKNLLASPKNVDLSVIEGTDFYKNTKKAVKELGGMRKFVPKNSKVGILINADFDIPGAYVHPDISLATIEMCFKAGASEVTILQNVKDEYWKRGKAFEKTQKFFEKATIIRENQFPASMESGVFKPINPEGKVLTESETLKKVDEIDVCINIAIAKHHATTLYTGALKNMMGINTRKANVHFHLGGPAKNDPEFLSQCIVDINAYRKSDLIIMDATHFITSGGPVGPGETMTPNKIVAGTDIVAVDSYCTVMQGFEMGEILTVQLAHNSGLGNMDFSKLTISEISA